MTQPPTLSQPDCDALYAHLMQAHDGLTKEQSDALNARLILLLFDAIADPARISAAINSARESARPVLSNSSGVSAR